MWAIAATCLTKLFHFFCPDSLVSEVNGISHEANNNSWNIFAKNVVAFGPYAKNLPAGRKIEEFQTSFAGRDFGYSQVLPVL